MCEIFPEVSNCCFLVSLRIGMLIISVLTLMTGVAGLCGIEKVSDASYNKFKNVTEIRGKENTKGAMSHIGLLVPTGITIISCIFMITGVILLFATLTDAEGFIQIFVWLTFFAVIYGFFMVIAVGVECLMGTHCILRGLDWLSGSAILILAIAYLFLWIYFIIVANSYILYVYS